MTAAGTLSKNIISCYFPPALVTQAKEKEISLACMTKAGGSTN